MVLAGGFWVQSPKSLVRGLQFKVYGVVWVSEPFTQKL